jgi:hypothetical protein
VWALSFVQRSFSARPVPNLNRPIRNIKSPLQEADAPEDFSEFQQRQEREEEQYEERYKQRPKCGYCTRCRTRYSSFAVVRARSLSLFPGSPHATDLVRLPCTLPHLLLVHRVTPLLIMRKVGCRSQIGPCPSRNALDTAGGSLGTLCMIHSALPAVDFRVAVFDFERGTQQLVAHTWDVWGGCHSISRSSHTCTRSAPTHTTPPWSR